MLAVALLTSLTLVQRHLFSKLQLDLSAGNYFRRAVEIKVNVKSVHFLLVISQHKSKTNSSYPLETAHCLLAVDKALLLYPRATNRHPEKARKYDQTNVVVDFFACDQTSPMMLTI